MSSRCTLIGYRASGKSTIGRLVAARLAWPFIDADQVIEARIGEPIAHYFRSAGEAAFRQIEVEVLNEILHRDGPMILATGGGAVLRAENRTVMAARGGMVVYLDVPVEVVQERLRHSTGGRPSLTGQHPADEAPRLMAERDPLYRSVAKAVIPAGSGAVAEVAQRVSELFAV